MDSECEFLKKIHKISRRINKSIAVITIKCVIPTSCKTINKYHDKKQMIRRYEYEFSLWPIKQKFGNVFISSCNHIHYQVDSINIINMTNIELNPIRMLPNHKLIFIIANNKILIFKYVSQHPKVICKYKDRNMYETHSQCSSDEICLNCHNNVENINMLHYDFKLYKKINGDAYLAQNHYMQIIYYEDKYYTSKTNSQVIPYWFSTLVTGFTCDNISNHI